MIGYRKTPLRTSVRVEEINSTKTRSKSALVQRRRKEVWDGEPTGGLGMGVPQQGPGAEPR